MGNKQCLPMVTIVRPLSRFLGFAFDAFLNAHVLEFAGLENFAALQALHEFGVLIAAYDLHTGVLAGQAFWVGRLGKWL